MEKHIIKQALISEKSFSKTTEGKFTFIVDKKADKAGIESAITELFGVKVLDINIANYKGKIKKTKKNTGKRSDFKKAIITLKKGEMIDLFEVENPDEKSKKVEGESETQVKVKEKKANK